jgi:hypothetical protein
MPVWWVTEPSLCVWLRDKPVWYQPSRGPENAFQLYHKDEMISPELDESQTKSVFSIGDQWLTPWRCYLLSLDGTGTNNFDFYNGQGGAGHGDQ